MNRLFIHNPLFRLFSPVFSGIIVYLLILLINNNVEQLQEQFLGEELYVCIGLSFIIQEFSRLLLWVFNKLSLKLSVIASLFIQIMASMILCAFLVTLSISLYYKNILGFSPSSGELWLFNGIFCCITLIYVLLHISHQYLYKVNSKKLNNEYIKRQIVEDDFMQFKKGINPNLLFECFEAIIVLIRKKSEHVDDLIDNMAMVYRYILSRKSKQLVLINEEINALDELAQLFNYLPFTNLSIDKKIETSFLVVPGSLLSIVENIIRSSINNSAVPLNIQIDETDSHFRLSYAKNDKIISGFRTESLNDIDERYAIYSNEHVTVQDFNSKRIINIPKLIKKPIHESCNNRR